MTPEKIDAVRRRDAEGLIHVSLRFVRPTEGDLGESQPGVRHAKIAVERKRPLKFPDAPLRAVGQNLHEPEPEVRPVVAWLDGKALEQQRLRGGQPFRALIRAIEGSVEAEQD